ETSEEPFFRIPRIQLRRDASLLERLFLLTQTIELAASLEVRVSRLIVDRKCSARVSQSQSELTQLSQNFRSFDQRVIILWISQEPLIQRSEFGEGLLANVLVLSTAEIFAHL